MQAKYSVIDLSKYIVTKCTKEGHPITNLQLQKILYHIQKAFLDRNELAFGETIEAWRFGPVVPESYYLFCGFGSMPLDLIYDDAISLDPTDEYETNNIIDIKRSLDPWELVEETHRPGGAWDEIFNSGMGNHTEIPTTLIKEVG